MARRIHNKFRRESLIPVVHARSRSEAELYRALLEDQEIKVVIEGNFPGENAGYDIMGIPVKVPEDCLEEAQNIIDQRNGLEDEFELSFEEYREEEQDARDIGVEGDVPEKDPL